MDRYDGSYQELQRMVTMTGIAGDWRELDQKKCKQFVAGTGAILNFWPSTTRISFQGRPDAAIQQLREKLTEVVEENENRDKQVESEI